MHLSRTELRQVLVKTEKQKRVNELGPKEGFAKSIHYVV